MNSDVARTPPVWSGWITGSRPLRLQWPSGGKLLVLILILALCFLLLYPALFVLLSTFNVTPEFWSSPRIWGLANWRIAFSQTGLLLALWHSLLIWLLSTAVTFPIAVFVAWLLARTNLPFSRGFEFMFWIAFMLPNLSTTLGWILLLDSRIGFLNMAVRSVIPLASGPFDVFTVPGIVFAHVMTSGLPIEVMLLTPAFRNMDTRLEEAARASGANGFQVLRRVTLSLVVSPMVLVLALHLLRIFQSFEIEQLLGVPFGFYVYSTRIYDLIHTDAPNYGQASVLASLTLVVLAMILPIQRRVVEGRRYTTISSSFKPGLIDLGRWRPVVTSALALLVACLTVVPLASLVMGSFMTRAGIFGLATTFTFNHWSRALQDPNLINAVRLTLIIATTAAVLSPLLFSLVAYILVRTRVKGRSVLDFIIWISGAMPGILVGLGLLSVFLGTPGLKALFGSIWALLIVVVLRPATLGTNVMKGVFVQVGQELEDAARVFGAGWFRVYWKIWLPLLMPMLIVLGVIDFVIAANATSDIVLVASQSTTTMSLLALQMASSGFREQASIISILLIVLTVGLVSMVRLWSSRRGLPQATPSLT